VSAPARHVAAFALLFATLLAAVSPGSGRSAGTPVGPLPLLGTADSDTTLMGAAPAGVAGEAWAYRQLPLAVGEVHVGSRGLAFGPAASVTQPDPQLTFLRHTDSSGWQVFDTPVDESGHPYRGPLPNRLSARITPAGGGVLVGRDLHRPVDRQVVVLDHDPGGSWHALEQPPADVLLPVEGERPAEALAAENGSGAIAVAAFDEGSHTGLLFGPSGRSVADGIVHFDSSASR